MPKPRVVARLDQVAAVLFDSPDPLLVSAVGERSGMSASYARAALTLLQGEGLARPVAFYDDHRIYWTATATLRRRGRADVRRLEALIEQPAFGEG